MTAEAAIRRNVLAFGKRIPERTASSERIMNTASSASKTSPAVSQPQKIKRYKALQAEYLLIPLRPFHIHSVQPGHAAALNDDVRRVAQAYQADQNGHCY